MDYARSRGLGPESGGGGSTCNSLILLHAYYPSPHVLTCCNDRIYAVHLT